MLIKTLERRCAHNEFKVYIISNLTGCAELFTGYAFNPLRDEQINSLLIDMNPWIAFRASGDAVMNENRGRARSGTYHKFRLVDQEDTITSSYTQYEKIVRRIIAQKYNDVKNLDRYLRIVRRL